LRNVPRISARFRERPAGYRNRLMSDVPVDTAASPAPAPPDRFVAWPMMWLLAVPICFVLLFAGAPVLVLLIGIVPLMWWVAAALARPRRKEGRCGRNHRERLDQRLPSPTARLMIAASAADMPCGT
jgi:hypothetical protein